LPSESTVATLLEDLASAARPAKLLAAARHAAEHAKAGTKLLVWTNFIGNVRELERLLDPYGTAVVTGATPRSDPAARTDRERELRRFREDSSCTVLIATPQTLGEGISLHKVCQAQLHVDRSFNAGLYLQSMDRTHRVGMPEGTTAKVTVLSALGTIDERVDRALRDKLVAMDEVLRDPTLARLSRVTVDPAAPAFTDAELGILLGHLRTI
jgi:SNF2 family DNA or RNA helicase